MMGHRLLLRRGQFLIEEGGNAIVGHGFGHGTGKDKGFGQ
jgi:hypothetical protein